MTIKEAIKKAIENGYDGKFFLEYGRSERLNELQISGQFLLDPDFWKALFGKDMVCEDCGTIRDDCECQRSGRGANKTELWKYQWHSLIDHLASGGSIEGFFKEL